MRIAGIERVAQPDGNCRMGASWGVGRELYQLCELSVQTRIAISERVCGHGWELLQVNELLGLIRSVLSEWVFSTGFELRAGNEICNSRRELW